MGRSELEAKLAVLMGGRAAEMLIGPDVSTGAADDLARATDIARGMILRYGMDDTLGPVAWDTEEGHFLDQPGAFWRPRRFSRADGARNRSGGANDAAGGAGTGACRAAGEPGGAG